MISVQGQPMSDVSNDEMTIFLHWFQIKERRTSWAATGPVKKDNKRHGRVAARTNSLQERG